MAISASTPSSLFNLSSPSSHHRILPSRRSSYASNPTHLLAFPQITTSFPQSNTHFRCSLFESMPLLSPRNSFSKVKASAAEEEAYQEEFSWTSVILPFVFPALGGLLFGYDIGATSGATISLQSPDLSGTTWFNLSAVQLGLVVSGSLYGALFGSILVYPIADFLGRKRELLLAALLYLLGGSITAMLTECRRESKQTLRRKAAEAEECWMILTYRRPTAVAVELRSQLTTRKFVSSMEDKIANLKIPETREHFHYNHTDSCNFSRWTSRESYVFMYARPWQNVVNFYSNVVNGQTTLLQLLGAKTHHIHEDTSTEPCEPDVVIAPSQKRAGRWARPNFKIVLSYHGGSFDGWQKQPGLNTVQEVIEKSLGKFVDEKKAALLRDKDLPLQGCVVVAGRTDKGVTGCQQVCSFYTWRDDVRTQDIEDAINSQVPGKLRVISVSQVSRTFHPNFSAKWRRYLYIFPLNNGEAGKEEEDATLCFHEKSGEHEKNKDDFIGEGCLESAVDDYKDDLGSIKKPTRFRVSKVNKLLQQLEGKLLSYKIFARDTKPSRNIGPPTECFMFHARATQVSLTIDKENGEYAEAMCIELVANRFLRKMVRVLVATSIREAAAGAEDDALIKLMDATCRRATAPPAPPDGLCLVDVGYKDFDSQTCLIL